MRKFLLPLIALFVLIIAVSARSYWSELATVNEMANSSEERVMRGAIVSVGTPWGIHDQKGLYSFPIVAKNLATISPVRMGEEFGIRDGVLIDRYHYTSKYFESGDAEDQWVFSGRNIDTWETTDFFAFYTIPVDILAYDITADELYSFGIVSRWDPEKEKVVIFRLFYKVGYKKEEMIYLGEFEDEIVAAAFDNEGQLYMIVRNTSNIADLYKVDKRTLQKELVGSTGIRINNLTSGFVYDEIIDKFYWTANEISSTALYELDLNTGKATFVTGFPDKEQFVGIYVYEEISDAAPADITDLKFVASDKENKTGIITFTVPIVTQNGEPLNGQISALLYIGGDLYDSRNGLSPGQSYEKEISIDKSGATLIRVFLSNDNGKNQGTKYMFWVGPDYPLSVDNLKIELNEEKFPLISWNPVTKGVSGGYIDRENLRYRIIRYPDNIIIEEAFDGTNYLDKSINGYWEAYSYEIIPYINDFVGEATITEHVITGKPFDVPFDMYFDEASFLLWSVIDSDEDGQTWYYSPYFEGAHSPSSNYKDVDDWFVSPPIFLEGGTAYKASYKVKARYSIYSESFKVYYSKSPEPGDESQVFLGDYPELTDTQGILEEVDFIVPANEGGEYYLLFYCYSEKSKRGMIISEVHVDLLADPNSPAAVENLKMKTSDDGYGNPPVTINFTAPALTVSGSQLGESSLKLKVYRNDVLTQLSSNGVSIVPGLEMEIKDESPEEGLNKYRIVFENEYGEGLFVEESIFIGKDMPGELTRFSLERDDDGFAVLTWSQPVGVHQGYVDLYNLYYKIQRNDGVVVWNNYQIPATEIREEYIPVEEGSLETRRTWGYTIQLIDKTVSLEDQNLYSYTITPYYVESELGLTSESEIVRFGAPYVAPYYESFAKRGYDKPGWSSEILSKTGVSWKSAANLTNTTFSPQDKDSGMAVCEVDGTSTKTRFVSPVLNISQLDSPLLRFWFTHYDLPFSKEENYLLISLSSDNGENIEVLSDTIYLDVVTNGKGVYAGWNLYEFNLENYKKINGVQIGFEASLSGSYNVAIDNVSVIERPNKDLKVVNFNLPTRLFAGYLNDFEVSIKNSGKEIASNYTISLYKDDKKISELSGNENPIVSGETKDFIINTSFAISEIGNTYSFHIKVDLEGDELEEDNISQNISGKIEPSIYAGVPELVGAQEEGRIILGWSAPEITKTPIIIEESFEEYAPFIINNIGEWEVIDVDGYYTINMYESEFYVPYDNMGAPMAYQVFNASEVSPESDSWNARTGSQVLASFVQIQTSEANNDWLISPELNGSAQEVVFYAKGINEGSAVLERFVFYYSKDGKELKDFVPLSQGDFVETPARWTEYRYILPEGSRYFAIQCVSLNSLTFLIDDISFVKGGDALTLVGYNVYRNDVKLNSTILPSGTMEYVDESPIEGGKTYTVTAVYANECESNYSNAEKFDYVGISNNDTDSILVYSPLSGGIVIEGADSLSIQIIGIDGSLVYHSVGTGFDKISLSSGSYIVKIGKKVTKVIVR